MPYAFPPDVAKLVTERMQAGGYATEDDVLRDALDVLGKFALSHDEAQEEFRQTVTAVKEGVADMQAGRMHPLREMLAESREPHRDGID